MSTIVTASVVLVAAEAFWQVRDVDALFDQSVDGILLVTGDKDRWDFLVRRRCKEEGLGCAWSRDTLCWAVTKPEPPKIAG